MPNPYVNKVVYGNETIIDLTSDDVLPADVRQGVHFHGADGAPQIGTSSGGGGGTPYAIISVTYPSGSVCTCTKGSTVLTAEGTEGKFNFGVTEAGEWALYCTDGSDESTDYVTITNQYEIAEKTLTYYIDPILNNNLWERISIAAQQGLGDDYWDVGDRKTITIDTIGSFDVYILGFNHYGASNTIDFGGFKQTSDGKDLCLWSYRMNTSNTNNNGWKGSYMRYNVLGSTNISNGDATSTCATSPVSGSLMAKFPADLRQVMKPMTIWTDNVGGGRDTASNVTTSVDYLPLLAEFEIFGRRTNANSAEQNHQARYAYYANGASAKKYQHDSTGSVALWWYRSPYYGNVSVFGVVDTSGKANGVYAADFSGIAPIFRV